MLTWQAGPTVGLTMLTWQVGPTSGSHNADVACWRSWWAPPVGPPRWCGMLMCQVKCCVWFLVLHLIVNCVTFTILAILNFLGSLFHDPTVRMLIPIDSGVVRFFFKIFRCIWSNFMIVKQWSTEFPSSQIGTNCDSIFFATLFQRSDRTDADTYWFWCCEIFLQNFQMCPIWFYDSKTVVNKASQ